MAIKDPINKSLGANVKAFPQTQYNVIKTIIDAVNDIQDGTSSFDTISELTAGNGVTVDGVILKDTTVDVNGTADAIILDADGDTTISSPTDDQIDFEIAGADDFRMTANTFTALSGSSILTDTISETTGANGVVIDGVKLKDNNTVTLAGATNDAIITAADQANQDNTYTIPDVDADASFVMTGATQSIGGAKTFTTAVTVPDGVVGTPGVKTTTTGHGLYEVSTTQLGFSVAGALATVADTSGLSSDSLRARVEPGTVNTGVTAVTYGDGVNFTTKLTVSVTDAVTVADNAALAAGYLLYTLPAGAIVINSAYMSIGVTLAEDTTATADVGLGTTIGSGANATLNLVAAGAAENILTGQTSADCSGTATVKTVADQVLVIEAAGDHTVYFNIADTWADTAGADLTGDIAGTVTLQWTLMS